MSRLFAHTGDRTIEVAMLSHGEDEANNMNTSSVETSNHGPINKSNPYAREKSAPVGGEAPRMLHPPSAAQRPAPFRALPPEDDDDDDAMIEDYLNENDQEPPEDFEEYENHVPPPSNPSTEPTNELRRSEPVVPERTTVTFREAFDSDDDDDEPLLAAAVLRTNRPRQESYKFERYGAFIFVVWLYFPVSTQCAHLDLIVVRSDIWNIVSGEPKK
jgi:hypothetical protein